MYWQIECIAKQCLSDAVIQDSGIISCNSTRCLYFAAITNVSKVICNGYLCLYNATIENNAIIICEGEQCLYNATIRNNVSSIVVNGNNGLSGSVVITESYGETNISISGTNDDIFNIYCNSTDECFIDCQSSNACSKLFLHCFGHCYVNCDQSIGIDCPIFGVYDLWTSSTPTTSTMATSTSNPSGYPEMIPTHITLSTSTVISTFTPTQIPSATDTPPTRIPNLEMYPTRDRSISPSQYPTVVPNQISTMRSYPDPTDLSNRSLISHPTFATTSQNYSVTTINTTSSNNTSNISESSDDGTTSWTGQTTTQDNVPGARKGNKLVDTLISNNTVLITAIICISVVVLIIIGCIYSKKQRRIQVNKEVELQRVHTVSRHDLERHSTNGNNNANRDGEDVVDIDAANYLQWTQEEVLVWLKIHLRDSKMNEDVIEPFLNEFEQQHITGTVLQQLKMNQKLIDQLQCRFSHKNQAFGVWISIKTAIESLGNV